MLLLLTHLVCQVCSNMFAYTKVPPFRLLIVVGRSVPSDLFLPVSQFPTINLLSIRPAWARRNFRHISRKIMKTTTTTKKNQAWVLEKSDNPTQEGNTQETPKNKPESRGTVLFGCVLFPGVARQARPSHVNDACMHAFGEEKPFCCSCFSVQLCEKKRLLYKVKEGPFLWKNNNRRKDDRENRRDVATLVV